MKSGKVEWTPVGENSGAAGPWCESCAPSAPDTRGGASRSRGPGLDGIDSVEPVRSPWRLRIEVLQHPAGHIRRVDACERSQVIARKDAVEAGVERLENREPRRVKAQCWRSWIGRGGRCLQAVLEPDVTALAMHAVDKDQVIGVDMSGKPEGDELVRGPRSSERHSPQAVRIDIAVDGQSGWTCEDGQDRRDAAPFRAQTQPTVRFGTQTQPQGRLAQVFGNPGVGR